MMMAVRPRSSRSMARSMRCSVAGSRREEASSRMTRPGIAQEDAREGQQLGLARRKAVPAGVQLRIQPLGQRARTSRPAPALPARPRMRSSGMAAVEEGQVVAHAGAEELHILGDDADALAQRLQPGLAQFAAVQPDAARRWDRTGGRPGGSGWFCRCRCAPAAPARCRAAAGRTDRCSTGSSGRCRQNETSSKASASAPSGRWLSAVGACLCTLGCDLAQLGQALDAGADGLEALRSRGSGSRWALRAG